ncbi:MAG: choice-of-anchor J domain-containing protein [Bacteroidales bacterium]|nr:choice-of-anchor J domain-containing protein [Bacteroidales bacterium]
MKKIDKLRVTLLGFLVCLMSMSLMAQRVTMDFTTNEWGLPVGSSAGITASTPYTNADGYTITLAASTKFYFHNEGYLMLGKSGSTLTLPAFDFNVEKIEIVGTSGASESVKQNIYVGDAAVSTETTGAKNVTNVYQIADAYQAAGNVYTIKVTSAHNTQITYIKVYEAASPAAVAAPTFNPAAGNYFAAQNLTITTTTSGAAIYYTLDSSDPKTNGILYGDNQVIPINQNTVVKAIAVLGEDTSNVTTATYTLNIPVEVATIAEFKAAEHSDNTIYKITGDVKVLGQYEYNNEKYTFIQDMGEGTYAALCIYDNNGSNINNYNPGDVISGGVYGTYYLYHNLIEMNPVEGLPSAEGTPGEVIAPDVRTLANVSAYPDWFESKLVTIKGLTFTESRTFGTTSATRGVVAVNGDDTINVYNGWGAITGVEVSEGMTADVTGFISRYNDILEIIPRGSEDIVEVVGPAVAPWTATFEDALENSAWEIENGNANKWFIGQAQGFDNNKLYISSNNGTTNKYIAEYSFVKASRAIVIPQNGAVLSFDYRVNGNNNDYMQVSIVKGGESTPLERLSGANEWTNATYTISPDMAGEATLVFLWTNQVGNANQFPAAIDNVSLMESSCSQPTALQPTVEGTTATISWTGDAEAYLLQYKLADHSEWYSVNTTENTVVLNNLQGNSNYNVRVQSVCGDDASAWVEGNFVVKCQNLIIDEEEVTFGNGTSTYYYHFPLSAYYYHSYTQQLFTEEELAAMGITAGSQMSAISFNYFWGTATTRPITIWLGTTTMTSLSSAFVPKDENFVQVYSNNCQEFSNSNENWVKLSFDQSFTYNGGSLVVAVLSNKENGECFTQYGSTSRFYLNSQQGKARYHSDDYNEITFDASGMPQSGYNRTVSSSDYRNNIKFDATKFVCGDVEACPAVTNVQVDNITPNSAELTWNRGNESETNFKVEYYAEGSTDVQSVLVEDTAYTLSYLAQLTNYTVKVQALCGENNTSEPVEIEFATSGICPPVSDIQSSNASNTTTLTWIPGGEERAWLVQFKPAEAGDNEWISINVNALPTTTFGGLLATTAYEVRVKAICDPEDEENQSTWTNYEFTSGCAAFDVPFAETFDSYSMPTCWDVDGFRFSSGYAYSYDLDAWIMTPAINIPSDETTYLAFDVKGYGNFSVMASYRGTDASRFAEIYSGEIESGSNYTQVVVPMADNLKGRQVYFKIVNNADQYQYIDNLSVDYCPFVPANLTVSNITENSAVLAWTADEAVNNFQVKVGENIIDVEGAKTYTLTGLDASTTYTFFVRTQCGEDSYGDWSAEKTFTTACPAVTLPYTEDFESSTCPADCWTIIYASGDPSTNTMMHTTDQHSVGQKSFRFSSMARVSPLDQYLISPELANHGELLLTFDYKKSSSGSEQFRVGYSTTTNNISAFTWGSYITNATTSWQEYSQTLPAGVKYIAIDYNSDYQYYLYIDNFNVMAAPTCGTPTLAVNGTTATITPSTIGEPASYELKIGEETRTVPETETTVDLASIFTLAPQTTYSVSVRANCGEGDYSEWSAEVSFTTPCMAVELPFVENFNTLTSGIPECWDNSEGTTTDASYKWNYWNGGKTGACVKFNSYTNSSNKTNFLKTPAVVLSGNATLTFSYKNPTGGDFSVYIESNGQRTLLASGLTGQSSWKEKTYDLTAYTGQEVVVIFKGTSNWGYGDAYIYLDDITIQAPPTCGTPTLAVNGTTATITPKTPGTPESYELKIGEETRTVPETETTVDLASIFTLAPSTTYSVSVRANCGGGDYSEWSAEVSFTTPCMAVELPFVENFNTLTSGIPECWDNSEGTTTDASYKWNYWNGGKTGACVKFNSYTNSSNKTNFLKTPAVVLSGNATLTFSYKNPTGGDFSVYIESNGQRTLLASGLTGQSSWKEKTYDLTEYTGQEVVVIFKGTSNWGSGDAYIYLDDISITEIPFCVTPSIASVVPGTTNATVTVAASENAQSYKVVCVLHGEDIETGTPVAAEELTAIITGLTPATQYDVYARAICSETETSDWSDAYSFFTECAAYALPYTENFDSYTSSTTLSSSTMPICWSRLFTGTSTSYGAGIYPSTSYSRSGANSLRFYNYGSGTSASYGDAYAILPEMAANINVLGMELYARKYSSSYSSNFEVGVVTDVDNPASSFVPVQTIVPTSTSYEKFEVSFAEYTGTNGHIAFRMLKPTSSYAYAYIDDITVKQAVFEKDLAINSIDPIAWACDQSDAKVTINVENAGSAATITSFVANYVINTQEPVSETVNCNLAPGEKMSYTFNTTPVFEYGENTVDAYVEMEGDMKEENNAADSIIVSLLEPKTVPYTPTLSANLVNKGWNVVDANNDGITMDINNAAIVYSFNDTLDADDWMFTPCIEMAAGSYNVYFDYKANSSLTETFGVYYGQGANVDAMTNNIAYLDFNNTDYETAMLTITVAEDGIYNFGFRAMSLEGNLGFSITKFEVYPVVNVTVTSGANGTVTPNGVVPVNYGENLSLSIVPNTMYHVAGVWVDDVQVMSEDPYNSNFMIYTLENVTKPHNVFVDYKLEYHIIKSVANYNPAYTDVPGEFIPAATDTLIDPDPVTVNFAAAPHYHLYSLEMAMMNEEDMVDVTADVVDNEDHTYSYLTGELEVANYYFKATFRRDTVAVNYLVNTGKGYADASDVLAQGARYATWWDYSVANDVNAVANIRPYTTGDAHSDYHIVNVNVNGEDMGVIDTYTFENIQEDQNIAIDFGYQVTTSIRNYVDTYLGRDEVRGTITPDTQLVAEGYPTVVTGTVQEHFHLYNLFVDGVDMIDQVVFDGNNYSLTIDSTIANYNIEAVVKIDTFGIYYAVMDGQGYADASNLLVAPAEYTTWINYGDDFMMNLSPDRGFSIGSVIVDGENMYTANNYLFEYVEEHHYVAVTFVPNDYTITTNAYGHGTVTDGMSFTYDPESPVNYQFTATAEEGYHISAIVINDATVDLTGVTDTYTLTLEDVAANYVINAHFAINTYTVDVTAHNGGTTNIQGVVSYNYGENVTVIATADEGHYISSISIDGEVTEYTQDDNRTTYSIDFEAIHENHVVIVDFGVQKFNITATVDADANHGTINYASSFEANLSYGNSITLNFIPEENYQVSDVVVDGQSVGAVDSYEFANITADHNLVVSFAPIQYTLTATSNVDACTITPASTTVQAGSDVNYTLNVATGYHLLNVIANGEEVSVSGNAFTIANVQEDYEIFANFAPNNVTVTVAQPANATITPGTMTYAYGATPTYVIMPQAGYEVVSVTAGGAVVPVTYNNGVGTFTLAPVTADITLTATTAIKTFTITVINNAHGTIAPATQTVNYGDNVTFTITPEQFYAISDVKVDGASRGAISSYTFNNVTGNHTIEALFEAACYEPTNLTAMDITTTSAVLSWVGTAPSYEVRYRKAADANWNTQTVTVPTVTLTGLDSNTLYAWEVRAYCTAQLQSEWVANSFMTKAGAQPYDPTSIASAEFNTVKVYSHLNNVYVVNENGVAISSIAIFDINGKQVYTGSVNGSTEVISLNVANGSYIVRLASENGVGIYKVSIVR